MFQHRFHIQHYLIAIIHQRIDIETMSDHGWPIPLTLSSTKRVSQTDHRYKRSIRSSN